MTDGGVVVGFLDEAWPRTTDNSRWPRAFEKPALENGTPTATVDDGVFGSYAVIGHSAVECKDELSNSAADFFPRRPREGPRPPDRPRL